MTDYAATRNIVGLLAVLDRGGRVSVNSIRQKCKVGSGAAKRYLDLLKEFRDLTSGMQGAEKFWRRADSPDQEGTIDELAAVELSVRSTQWLRATPYHDTAQNHLDRLRACISQTDQESTDRFLRSFHHRTQGDASYPGSHDQMRNLIRAIRRRKPVTVAYQRHDGSTGDYELEPTLLVLYKDRIYLTARKRPSGERRSFLLESMSEVLVHEEAESFAIPSGHHTEHELIFRHSFGIYTDLGTPERVTLAVRGAVSTRLRRRRLHPTQSVEKIDGEWWRVSWVVAVCPELVSYVLSLLPDVGVLEPASLHQKICDAARAYPSSIEDMVR
ncbi:MAG: WYL domain-containing protein [Sandaracinaceae bacterium]